MTPPVQSFQRGLLILEYLNRHNGSNANAVSKGTGLTRGTTFRLLETLRGGKYVMRDSNSGRYFLKLHVRALSDGYSGEKWIDEIARPKLHALGQELVWPMTISTPSGVDMLIRINTDFESPLSQNRFLTGHRVAILESASGLVFLSFCNEDQRYTLIEVATQSGQFKNNAFVANPQALENSIKAVRQAGFAKKVEGSRSVISVPIFSQSRILACLAMRYFSTAVSDKQVKGRFFPLLKKAADEITAEFPMFAP